MNAQALAGLVFGAVASLTAVSQAQAYTLHYWQDGTISWMCDDGITVGVMDDGSMPPEEVVIAACAEHGGMNTVDGDSGAEAHANVAPLARPDKRIVPTIGIAR